MAVSDRIEASLSHFRAKNYDSALLELSAAIDQTAKLRSPNEKKVGVRVRAFLHDYREFILFGAMGFGVQIFGDLNVDKVDDTLAKLLYKRVRNPVVHDAGINETFEVLDEPGIMMAGPTIGLRNFFILAAILAVIGDLANRWQRLKVDQTLAFGDVKLRVNECWGNFEAIKKAIVEDSEARHQRLYP